MKYDFIIIGGGMSGLVCAFILSKEGKKVVVLEKNSQSTHIRIIQCLRVLLHQLKIYSESNHFFSCSKTNFVPIPKLSLRPMPVKFFLLPADSYTDTELMPME